MSSAESLFLIWPPVLNHVCQSHPIAVVRQDIVSVLPVKAFNLHGLAILNAGSGGDYTVVTRQLSFSFIRSTVGTYYPGAIGSRAANQPNTWCKDGNSALGSTYVQVRLVLCRLVKADLANSANLTRHCHGAAKEVFLT